MVRIVHLVPAATPPEHGTDDPWLIVEAAGDGGFFGTGAAWKTSGEWVGYLSLAQDDVSLEAALGPDGWRPTTPQIRSC